MKKLLLTLLLPLITFSSVSYGEEINSLFGITLYDNAEKYVSSNYINSNKLKNTETLDGYFNLYVTDEIKTKSPYVSLYMLVIDNNNRIHRIYGSNVLMNMDICQAVQESLLSQLEKRYQIEFGYWEDSYIEFKIYSNYHFTSTDNYFAVQCKEIYEKTSSKFQIYLDTPDLGVAIDNFYDSGL